MNALTDIDLSIGHLRHAYLTGDLQPEVVLEFVLSRIKQYPEKNIWINVLDEQQIQNYIKSLKKHDPAELPLYGIPFAIKDNIDLAGLPTTVACADYSYNPIDSAFAVQLLIDAGAIPIGKTNLDQFATGLVGTRSPYGAVSSAFDDEYIAGGSSSGSAVAVALGQVSFALGTDTAGSGRIPAAFNNLIGLKPSRGLISTTGVVPACRSLDCVSLFTLNPDDALLVFDILNRYDDKDCYARKSGKRIVAHDDARRIGVPDKASLEFFGHNEFARLFEEFLNILSAQGYELVPIDFEPFIKSAKLLYQGPWLAERYAAIESFIKSHPDSLLPVTRQIIEPASAIDAVECFKKMYELQDLKREADRVLEQIDMIITPTAGTDYRLEEINAEPIQFNTNLGYYTNFMNLLDYAAVSLPADFDKHGHAFGVTLFGQAFSDETLLFHARQILKQSGLQMGATAYNWKPVEQIADEVGKQGYIDIAVCGAHLSGMPLNHQLTERQGVLVKQTQTAERYRLYVLAGGPPYRPGLILDNDNGKAIDIEVWRMPLDRFGEFMLGIPHPLGIGKVFLDDGKQVNSFICEAYAVADAEDITHFGGWRSYIESLQ